MPERKLIMITGRSICQGTGISNGKDLEEYVSATMTLELNPLDLERFGLQEGASVRVKTVFGEATVICRSEKLPEGLAFMAFGPTVNRLVGGETYASGMPDTKGFEIELEQLG